MMINTDDKKVQFLPFHAINEFMRNDYRLAVVRTTLNSYASLPEEMRAPIDKLIRKVVQVPGFRNSAKAPTNLKVRPTAEAFEKNPRLVAAILAAWSELHAESRQKVHDLLTARGWDILPVDADRTKLPGFLITWPQGEEFEVLNKAFDAMYPGDQISSDDISLMVVWISGRLPYQIDEQENSGENHQDHETRPDSELKKGESELA